MTTLRIDRATARVAGFVAAAAAWLVAGEALWAQEPGATWVSEERARIGVLLEEVCEAPPSADAVCDRPPVVTSVVVDGPADRAGVRARDTLLTVNGLDVTRSEGRSKLLGMEAGVPVELEVGREGGRTIIEVTPEVRSTEPYFEVRTFFGPPEEIGQAEGQARVRIMRLPVRTKLEELEVRLDSLQGRGNDFVFFHQDTTGHFTVEVGDPGKAHVILERMREGDSWTERTPLSVWENEELARRLEVVRDSSFASARVRLDSLVRLRGQFRVLRTDSLGAELTVSGESDPSGEWAYYFTTPRAVPNPLRTLMLSDVRVGGAEFRPLSRDMAEYFAGVEEGLLVLRVIRDTPADRMGLRDGDVVTEVDGAKCNDIKVLREAIARAVPARSVEVKWVRKGAVHVGNLHAP